MKLNIKGLGEREATIIPLPNHVFCIGGDWPRPDFPYCCAIVRCTEEEKESEGEDVIIAPISGCKHQGYTSFVQEEIREEVTDREIIYIRKFHDQYFVSEKAAVADALRLFLLHGTPIDESGRDAAVNVIGLPEYERIINEYK